MEKSIIYFPEPGPVNTQKTLKAALDRAAESDIRDIVIATSSGATGLELARTAAGNNFNLLGVTLAAGRWAAYQPPDRKILAEAEDLGMRFHTATHVLMGNVGLAVKDTLGGVVPGELIARSLYLVCQGLKVAVEISLMAADAGLIPMDRELIAIAGSDHGADTAAVIGPAYSNTIFDLKVREIIAMPR
jgi:hypothetical protein